jgi:hypothetical protein
MVKEIKEINITDGIGNIKVLFEKQSSDGQIYRYICGSNFHLENCVEIDKLSGQELVDYVNILNLNWILIEQIYPV